MLRGRSISGRPSPARTRAQLIYRYVHSSSIANISSSPQPASSRNICTAPPSAQPLMPPRGPATAPPHRRRAPRRGSTCRTRVRTCAAATSLAPTHTARILRAEARSKYVHTNGGTQRASSRGDRQVTHTSNHTHTPHKYNYHHTAARTLAHTTQPPPHSHTHPRARTHQRAE